MTPEYSHERRRTADRTICIFELRITWNCERKCGGDERDADDMHAVARRRGALEIGIACGYPMSSVYM